MQFLMTPFVLCFSSLFVLGTALPLFLRDVFVPPITYPHEGTVWASGQRHNVTWDISKRPQQITNPTGRLVLAKAGRLDIEHPLATNFDLLDGRIEIAVPTVPAGSDYALVLFGDSGNFSPTFTIQR